MHTGNKPVVVIIFLLIVALTVLGCGTMKTYSGPELPRDKIAVVKEDSDFLKGLVSYVTRAYPDIQKVDGMKRGHFDGYFAVKPGEHTLAVIPIKEVTMGYFVRRTSYPLKVLSFEAEAGHTYVVHVRMRDGRPMMWIDDEKTQEVVAGQKPE